MDRSEVRTIVDREIEPLMKRFGIGHWGITCSYRPSEANDDGQLLKGECNRLDDYNSAHILFNPEAFESESEVLTTLRHELFHIVLSPFDLYTEVVERAELAAPTAAAVDRVRQHALEKTVVNLERMFAGLTLPPVPTAESAPPIEIPKRKAKS